MSISETKKGYYTVQISKSNPSGGPALRLCKRVAGLAKAQQQEAAFRNEADAWLRRQKVHKAAVQEGLITESQLTNSRAGQIPANSIAFGNYVEQTYLPWFRATHPRTGERILRARASSLLVVAEDLAGVALNEVDFKIEKLVEHWQVEGVRHRGVTDRRGRALNRKARPISTAGINERIRRIREVLSHAYDKRFLDLPPRVKLLTTKGARPGAEKPIRYFAADERVRFLRYAEADVVDVFNLACMTGMRPAEVFHARVDWVDFKNRKIVVQACECNLCPGGTWISKTGRHRSIDIASALLPLLRKLTTDKSADARLIANDHGRPISRLEGSNGRFKSTLRRAGLDRKGLSFYSCRHTFAADLITAGTSLAKVAALLGNSVQVCETFYGHLIPGHTAEDVEAAIKATDPWPGRETISGSDTSAGEDSMPETPSKKRAA